MFTVTETDVAAPESGIVMESDTVVRSGMARAGDLVLVNVSEPVVVVVEEEVPTSPVELPGDRAKSSAPTPITVLTGTCGDPVDKGDGRN